MFSLDIETFMLQAIQNAEPQPHRSKWTDQEDKIIANCIENGLSLSDIHRIISLRSLGAIRTRANSLGYGYKRNEDDGETYFSREINHKNRRTQDEIMEGKEFVSIPIESHNSLGKDTAVVDDIIPKVEVPIADINMLINMLIKARDSIQPTGARNDNAAGGDLCSPY